MYNVYVYIGMPERINDEVFIAMAKALDFIDPGINTYMYIVIHSTHGTMYMHYGYHWLIVLCFYIISIYM
jgi:hypothetical protein